MENILVTGGAGYIGSHVVKELLKKGYKNITVIDNLSTGFVDTIKSLKKYYGDFEFIKLDLSNWKDVEDLFKNQKFDSIIHFAAALIVPESVKNPIKYYLNNTANTTNLIRVALENGARKFIFSSTAAVYGEPVNMPKNGIKEDFETKPINPYGYSKLMSEQVLKDATKANSGFKYVILRYFNVAGADIEGNIGQSTKDATHLIKVASESAIGKREKMYIFGDDYPTPDGTCIRDYIHVDDLADAHIKALEYIDENGSDIFNCGYGRGYSVKEVIETMKKVSGVNFKVEIASRREGDPAILIANNEKIREKMNWKPKNDDLEIICKSALEWEKKID